MKIAYYYFPGLDPDEADKPFQNISSAIAWGKWFCEQNGGDTFSMLYGRKFFTYGIYEGEWVRNGKKNKNKTVLKSPTIKEEPKSRKK